jgi:hypothetical protein
MKSRLRSSRQAELAGPPVKRHRQGSYELAQRAGAGAHLKLDLKKPITGDDVP